MNPSPYLGKSWVEAVIREAQDRDIPQLSELVSQLGYPAEPEALKQRLNKLQEHEDYRTLVAECSGRVLGMMALHRERPLLRDQPEVQVMALVVSQESRGSGVGGRLLQAAEEWAAELGAFCVKLNSGNREERMAAHRFYLNQGYAAGSTGFARRIEDQK